MYAGPPSRWREEWKLGKTASGVLVALGPRIIKPQPYPLLLQPDPEREELPLTTIPTLQTMIRCSGLHTCRPDGRTGHGELALYVERRRRNGGAPDFHVGITCPAPCPALYIHLISPGPTELYNGLLHISVRAKTGTPLKVNRWPMSDRSFSIIM